IARVAAEAGVRALLLRAGLAERVLRLLRRILEMLGGAAMARLAHASGRVVARAVRGEIDGPPLRLVAVGTHRRLGAGFRLVLCVDRQGREREDCGDDREGFDSHETPFFLLADCCWEARRAYR